MDPKDPLAWLPPALKDLEDQGLRRQRRTGSGLDEPGRGEWEGSSVDFGSNDYLGLARDPRVAQAARDAAGARGWGSGASPVVCGRSSLHAELERRLADFEGAEAALLFSTGFAANAGVIPALVDRGDAVYSDAMNHASLIDGCRLSRAERHVYEHGDVKRLAGLLERSDPRGRTLIVTDGLFSMDGDFAPLIELGELAQRHGAMLLVDEAHATGVWGSTGRGSVERAAASDHRLPTRVTLKVGTLSKALGSIGGFVAGDAELIEWLHNRARPYVFSTSMPAAAVAAGIEALRIVQDEPQRRERLIALAEQVRGRLQAAGWSTGQSASQIVPIVVGRPEAAVELSDRLARAGVYVPAIRPPTVRVGGSLLRVSLSAAHGEAEVDRLLTALGPGPGESA